jgi:hypothetical protein
MAPMLAQAHCSKAYGLAYFNKPSDFLGETFDTPAIAHNNSNSISLRHPHPQQSPRQRPYMHIELLEIPSELLRPSHIL